MVNLVIRPKHLRDATSDALMTRECATCNKLGDVTKYVLCDACGEHYHLGCVGLSRLPIGFWYCGGCLQEIAAGHLRDVTVDLPLMTYLFQGLLPSDDCEATRVLSASHFLYVHHHDLIISGKTGPRVIPAIAERYEILLHYHRLQHCHGEKLYQTLSRNFFWRGLRTDCCEFVTACRTC